MILYSSPSSYYSMIARLALLECGAAFDIRRMDIHIAKEQLK
jgi:glutathione S-transferase